MRFRNALLLFPGALVLSFACGPMGDGAAAQRQWERDYERRVRENKEATATTPAGRKLAGEELKAALSERTHLFVYETQPGGRKGRYVESVFFRPDGKLIYTNSLWAIDPNGGENDTWTVEEDRLCYLNTAMSRDPMCYTLNIREDGEIQYYVHKPGDAMHGLLTKVTTAIRNEHVLASAF